MIQFFLMKKKSVGRGRIKKRGGRERVCGGAWGAENAFIVVFLFYFIWCVMLMAPPATILFYCMSWPVWTKNSGGVVYCT